MRPTNGEVRMVNDESRANPLNRDRGSVTGTMGAVGAAQVCSLGVSFLMAIVLARWLEPAGRGAFVLANLVAATVTTILAFGLPVSGTTFMLRREYPVQKVFSSTLTLALLRSAVSGAVVGLVWLIWARFRALGLPVFLLVWAICAMETLYVLARGLLFSVGRMAQWAAADVGSNLLFLVLMAGSWLVGKPGAAPYALLLYVLVRAAGIAYTLHAARRFVRLSPGYDRTVVRALFGFGSRNFLSDVVWTFGPRMDMYVVGGAMSAASLGIYSIATGLADRMTTVMTVVPTGLYRFQATSDNENRRVEKLTLRALRLSFALGLAISLAVVLVSRFAISLLFGKGYAMATIPLGILAVEATIGIGFYIFRGYLTGYRMKPEVSAVFGLVLVGLSTAASLILVRRLGITGAAIASLSGTVLVFLPFALYFRKTTGSSWRDMLLVTREDIGVVIAAARAVARRVFNRPVRSIQPLPNTILQPGSEDYGA